METQITPRIEKIEDLELLVQGNVVEVEGRKYPMRIHDNDRRDKILNLVGRNGIEGVQLIALEYSEVKYKSGKLILTKPPYSNSTFDERNYRGPYNFFKEKLEEAGIWENA